MSDVAHKSRGSHALAWTLSIVVAVPLLYVLTLPPLVMVAAKAMGITPGSPRMVAPPQWLMMYIAPYAWLERKTPFRKPLTAYGEWWQRTLGFGP